MTRPIAALLVALALAVPAGAQTRTPVAEDDTPALSLRPFFVFAAQQAAAQKTFDAVFGSSTEPFWGGGLQLAFRSGVFVEVSAARFKKTGERAFLSNGQAFGLGIPLTATITPFEVTGGYRFTNIGQSQIVPYVGGGFGSYSYKETSDFATAGEDVDARHAGVLALGGVELRVQRWIGIGIDAQYTHIPGILGIAGLSKDAGESDLGGIAARFRVLVGR